MLKSPSQWIALALVLIGVAGCQRKEAAPVVTETGLAPQEQAMTHVNFVIVTESHDDRAPVTRALSGACSQLAGGKPSDSDQLRRAEKADNTVVVEYSTVRHTYAQIVPATGIGPQPLLFLAGMCDGVLLVVRSGNQPPPAVCTQLFLLRTARATPLIVLINHEVQGEHPPEQHSQDGLRTILGRCGYEPKQTPVLYGNVRGQQATETGKRTLEAMDKRFSNVRADERAPFLFAVEDVFNIMGRGVVVTGTVERGTVRPGDKLELLGAGRRTSVECRDIETFQRKLQVARPGDNVGILLGGATPRDVQRGALLSASGRLALQGQCEGIVEVLTPEEGGSREGLPRHWRGQVILGLSEVEAVVHLAGDGERIRPGERGAITVTPSDSVGVEPGFTLVIHSQGRIVAVGRVTK
jgi:elongation factor Tu